MPPKLLRSPFRVGAWLVALVAALGLFLASEKQASAAVALSTGYPLRADTSRTALVANEKLATHGITRANCEAQEAWTFKFTIPSATPGYDTLRVFARHSSSEGSCAPIANREGTTKTCFLVASFAQTAVKNELPVQITATQMMVAAGAGSVAATDVDTTNVDVTTACFPTSSQQPSRLYLSVLLFSGETPVGDLTTNEHEYKSYFTTYDLQGPSLPGTLGVGAGSGILVASWGTSSTNEADLKGYQAYCYPDPNWVSTDAAVAETSTSTTSTKEVDAALEAIAEDSTDAGSAEADASAPVDTEDAVAEADAADEADAAEAAADTSVAPVVPSNCPSGVPFVEGTLPTTALDVYKCGDIFTTTSGKTTISGLTNDRNYAVAIAAVDNYGNTGLLSNVACDKPRETVDFYRAYVDAGGSAGGGYCAFGRSPFASAGVAMVLFTIVGLLRRRAHRTSQESPRDP